MIHFVKLKIEGFGSIVKSLSYDLGRVGLNLLIGKNGSGKSTIINALCWCLYKQTLKKSSTIETWPQLINKEYPGIKVSVKFNIGDNKYEVIRCRDYKGLLFDKKRGGNRLIVLENKVEITKLRDKADAEKWIRDKMGYSFELFKNTIVFGQSLKRITQEDGPTKKKIFDDAFEMGFINQAKLVASTKLDEYSKLGNSLYIQIEAEKKILTSYTEQYIAAKAAIQDFDKNKKRLIDEIKIQIEELLKKCPRLPDIQKIINELTVLKSYKTNWVEKEFNIFLSKQSVEATIENKEREINNLRLKLKNIPKVCDNCGQKIPISKIKAFKQKLRNNYQELLREFKKQKKILVEYTNKHELAKRKVDKYTKRQSEIKRLEKEKIKYEGIKKEVEMYNERLTEKEEEIKRVKKTKLPNLDISAIQEKKDIQERKVNQILSEYSGIKNKIDLYQWLIEKPLSNSGLKAFIFDNLLKQVNYYANQYKYITGLGIKAYVDMSSAYKNIMISIYKNNSEIPYEDLSGGQKQLVDVTLALAMNDTVNSIKPLSLLFLDEVFESLDEDNIEIVGDLIIKKSQNRSIHLITHQSKFSPPNIHITHINLNEQGETILSA